MRRAHGLPPPASRPRPSRLPPLPLPLLRQPPRARACRSSTSGSHAPLRGATPSQRL
uniref:Uncharacterized protein n=1 Tax=Arundo donax TaxID=35708 RepID=A0A0A9A090_ARUDO